MQLENKKKRVRKRSFSKEEENRRNRERYHKYKQENRCVACGKENDSITAECEECKTKSRVSMAKVRDKNVNQGRCRTCGRVLIEESGNRYCINCIEDGSIRRLIRRELYRGL